MKRKDEDPDEKLKPIQFTLRDRDLILGLTSLELDTEDLFKLVVVKGKGIVVEMNAYDLDELLGQVAAEANHAEKKRQKTLDALSDRIREKLDRNFPLNESKN